MLVKRKKKIIQFCMDALNNPVLNIQTDNSIVW